MRLGAGKTFLHASIAAAALLLLPAETSAAALRGDWAMANFDAHGLRYNPYETQITKKSIKTLQFAWKLDHLTDTKFALKVSSPAVVGGVLYVGSLDGHVYAVDAATGKHLWTVKLPAAFVINSPAVANGIVYISYTGKKTKQYGKLRALDAATGATLWTETLNYAAAGSPTVANGRIFQNSGNGVLHAFDALSGKNLWKSDKLGRSWQPPAVSDGVVYSMSDYILRAYDAASGAVLWEQDALRATFCCGSPAAANGKVYVNTEGEVGVFDAATGAEQWANRLGPNVNASIAVAKGHVYTMDQAGTVWNFDAASGMPTLTQEKVGFNAAPTIANGILYAGAYDGVRAYDIKTGALIWSAHTLFGVQSSPVVSNGMLYVVADALYAYALKN